ncbi:MFS transporter [Mangrovactinospora gilvigrisea]|uniref:MFS transporter n=2 Tax=Mangrovactinospora gilvigrisea TaxID=1428644 RepID=A0A1J7C5S5_9ACTN|nr:MFS transporter [Mangrovactinospora gilvigrisea]
MTSRQRLVLVLLLGSQFMISVDFSILNVALPAIGRGLHMATVDLQWVTTAMMLPSAGFALLFGRLGDLLGRRRMLIVGMALLAAGSLVGGIAQEPAVLLAARVVQGLAAAAATPAALALLTASMPEGPLRDRALGLNGTVLGSGFVVGALCGGLLTDLLSWRWAFFVNIPVAAVILAAVPALVAESRGARVRLDLPGAATVTTGLLALVFGVTSAAQYGWGSPWTLVALGAAVVLLAAFWLIELRSAAPLAPVRVLARRTVKYGNLGGLVTFAMESGVCFLLTLYLQKVLGQNPMETGLTFCGLGGMCIVGGMVAPRLIGRFGNRAVLAGGLALQAVSTAALALTGSHGGTGALLVLLAASTAGGFGHVSAIVGYMVTATSGLPAAEQGLATGLASMTQQVGVTVGIPVLSAVATAAGAGASGLHTALLVDAAVVLAGSAAVAVGLGRGRRAPVSAA